MKVEGIVKVVEEVGRHPLEKIDRFRDQGGTINPKTKESTIGLNLVVKYGNHIRISWKRSAPESRKISETYAEWTSAL